jgi:hypothetical protein
MCEFVDKIFDFRNRKFLDQLDRYEWFKEDSVPWTGAFLYCRVMNK